MQRYNIHLSNYMSNVGGKSYREVVKLPAADVTDPERLVKCVHSRTTDKWGRDTVKAALTGVVTEVDREVIAQLRDELEMATRHRAECLSKMAKMCNKHFSVQMKNPHWFPKILMRLP